MKVLQHIMKGSVVKTGAGTGTATFYLSGMIRIQQQMEYRGQKIKITSQISGKQWILTLKRQDFVNILVLKNSAKYCLDPETEPKPEPNFFLRRNRNLNKRFRNTDVGHLLIPFYSKVPTDTVSVISSNFVFHLSESPVTDGIMADCNNSRPLSLSAHTVEIRKYCAKQNNEVDQIYSFDSNFRGIFHRKLPQVFIPNFDVDDRSAIISAVIIEVCKIALAF